MTPLMRELASVSRQARKFTAKRDELIRAAKEEGHTLRAIGEVAGLTAPGVQRVLKRKPKPE